MALYALAATMGKNLLFGNRVRCVAICSLGHNDFNTKSSRMQTSSTQTSKRSGAHLGHGLSVLLAHHRELSAVATAAATPKRLRGAKGTSRLSHTWRSHTLACSQPSRSHPRTPPARNSAFVSTPSRSLALELAPRGPVLSWGWFGPTRAKASMIEQTSARKMVTYDRSRTTGAPYRAHWELPPVILLHFARLPRGPGGTKVSGAQQIPRSATTIQRAALTNLQSVWSGSKDLLADWRVKLLPVLLLHRSRVA